MASLTVPRAVQGDAPERLAEWRARRGLTQTQLAELLGVSQATVSDIESGAKYPGEEIRAAVARHCRIGREAWGEKPARRHAAIGSPERASRKLRARSAGAT